MASPIPYHLVRSQRKTLAIHITKEATVEVRAPLHLSKARIDNFVLEKQDWITAHLHQRTEKNQAKESFQLDYQSQVLYRGQYLPLVPQPGNTIGLNQQGFYLPPNLDSNHIKQAVIQIYKLLAKSELTRRVIHYAKQMEVTPTAVKVNSAKTRWGSCSSAKSLNFSWRLMLAEDAVIDYVVVHELAHIKEMNHSPAFWAVVAQMVPDYPQKRAKLKEVQAILAQQNWD